jgi:hypothetical protein
MALASLGGPFKIVTKNLPIYSNVKVNHWCHDPGDKREILRQNVFPYLFTSYRVAVYNYIMIFSGRSFQGVGRVTYVQQFYRRRVDTGDK